MSGYIQGSSVGSSYNQTVKNNGTPLTQRPSLNLIGRGFVANDDGSANTQLYLFDPTTMTYVRDEFRGGTGAAGSVGECGWVGGPGGVSYTKIAGEANHPGIWRIQTSAATTNTVLYLASSGITNGDLIPADFFDIMGIFRYQLAGGSNAQTAIRFGLSSDPSSNAAANGIYFERLAADTNWFAVTRSASSETPRSDTSVAAAANTWYRFRIRRKDSSTISFSVNGGAEIDKTTNIPTAALTQMFQVVTTENNHKQIDADFADCLITGITR